MPRRVVLLAVCIGLATTLLLPSTSIAGDQKLTPDRTADWWLWGDLEMKETAAKAVAQATPGFLKRFQRELSRRQADPAAAADRLIERAVADDAEAVKLLTGMGPSAIRRLLRRIKAAEAGIAGTRPPVVALPPVEDAPTRQVLITAEVYTLAKDGAGGILGSARAEGIHLLDDVETETVRRALKQSSAVTKTRAPRLLVEDRHWATIQAGEHVAYVKEFRAEKKDGNVVADPVIDTLFEGLSLELRPVVSPDARFVTLEGFVTAMVVKRPIPTMRVAVAGLPDEVEVQTPTLAESKLDLHVTVPEGGSVVGTGIAHPADERKEMLIVVRAVLAAPDEFAGTELAVAEAESLTVINVEVRALEASKAALERALGETIPDADRPALQLDPAQVLRLLGPRRLGAAGVKVLHAPNLTAFDGQKANVSAINQISFVQDYDVEVAKDGSQMVDPIIGVLQEGLVLEVTPRLSANRKAIRLDALATWADLKRPIPEFKTKIGKPPQEVTIQLPELTVLRIEDECRMAPGGWVLLGGFGEGKHGLRFILLHAEVVDLPQVKKKGR